MSERDVVAPVRADLDGVDAQHAVRNTGGRGGRVPSPWSVRMTNASPARDAAAAMASLVARSVGACGVNVIGAGTVRRCSVRVDGAATLHAGPRRQRREQKKNDGGHDGRRHQ